MIQAMDGYFSDLVILCIGTDRSTGDCLGPLVGHKLKTNYYLKNASVLGTLNEPVHAKNLNETVQQLYSQTEKPLIIAIDASLGKNENIGKINLFKGPLYPGAGVNKNLRSIGDISITGIVNISGYMEYIILQNTRLSLVMEMADTIALSLYTALHSNTLQFNNVLSV
jgi:putative sporulation protein YyaC